MEQQQVINCNYSLKLSSEVGYGDISMFRYELGRVGFVGQNFMSVFQLILDFKYIFFKLVVFQEYKLKLKIKL